MEKTTNQELTTIHDKLVFIQSNLVAPKELRNNFGNYNYRSAETILEAVAPLLVQTATSLVLKDEIVLIGERYYVKATATLKDATGATESSEAFAREEENKKGMDASQVTGATSSYARKYALNGLLKIDDGKDADSVDPQNKPSANRKSAPVQAPKPVTTPKPVEVKKPVNPPTKPAETKAEAEPAKTEETTQPKPNDSVTLERRQKALELFKKLDDAKVLAHIIQNEKILSYIKVEDFVNKHDIDAVLAIYKKVSKTCEKEPETETTKK